MRGIKIERDTKREVESGEERIKGREGGRNAGKENGERDRE